MGAIMAPVRNIGFCEKGAAMEFKRLTEQECRTYEGLLDVEYEESPLRNTMSQEAFDLLAQLYGEALDEDFEWMLEVVGINGEEYARAMDNAAFRKHVIRIYEHAVACGDAGSCCNLGNIYHGGPEPEDYEKVVALYELGAERGSGQASVNLGYVYYYGRAGKRDYARADECYARAVFLEDNVEALWKLGDLYAGGKGVPKSDRMAWRLYSMAYDHARSDDMKCRSAHHLADYLMKGIEGVVKPDPRRALRLYCEAELGYYRMIDIGLTYYARQLDQAIEGQAAARAAIQAERIESVEIDW